MNTRLYTVVTDYTDDDYTEVTSVDIVTGDEFTEYELDILNPHPHEWDMYCMETWGEKKPFFLPSAGRIYKSRSAAIERADLINYWGGKAKVLECTPVWEDLEAAKKRRERDRLVKRREKHVREAGALSARIRELS